MSHELQFSHLDPQSLATLTVEQLVGIIVQQQKVIEGLHENVSCTPTKGTLGAEGSPLVPPLTQATEEGFSQPFLTIQKESHKPPIPLIEASCWTIGRGPDNAIVLPDQWMSRNHAMVQATGAGEFYLIDLGSRNGSFVNGRRVSVPMVLRDRDLITFGETTLEFHSPLSSRDKVVVSANPPLEQGANTMPATHLLHVRRLISVLVVDIRSFTLLTRQLDERLLSEVVGTWFRSAGDIIREYGSWVDKYIGDAVMAVWIHGTQQIGWAEIQQPLQAVKALHAMTSHLHLTYPLPFPLKIGAGINTGYAMVGNAGSGDRPDYTALGDTVNVTFRLESSTKQLDLDLALGATTYQYLLAGQCQELPFQEYMLRWKGYDVPTPAYACSFDALNQFLYRQHQT